MENRIENTKAADLEQFLEDIKVVIRDGEELLKAGMGNLKERAAAGVKRTDLLVHERPYQTLGIAFGVGVLVGLLAVSMCSREATESAE